MKDLLRKYSWIPITAAAVVIIGVTTYGLVWDETDVAMLLAEFKKM